MKFKEKMLVWVALTIFVGGSWLVYAATPSTEAVQSRSDGLHVNEKITDRLGFYGAAPTPKPILSSGTVTAANIEIALAALGLMATATPTPTPSATFTPTPTP